MASRFRRMTISLPDELYDWLAVQVARERWVHGTKVSANEVIESCLWRSAS